MSDERSEQVTQDDEGPCTHVGAGLETLAGGPGFQERFLHEVVRQVAASRKGPSECPQVRDHCGEVLLELIIRQRSPFGGSRICLGSRFYFLLFGH